MRPVLRGGRNTFPPFWWLKINTRRERVPEEREDIAVLITRALWWYLVIGYAR